MVPYIRTDGPLHGHLPYAPKAAQPKASAFRVAGRFDPDWQNRAECRTAEDVDLFFPIGNTGPALLQTEDAKAFCRRCPVIDTCLAWALATDQEAGVWGGMSEDERYVLKHGKPRRRASRDGGQS